MSKPTEAEWSQLKAEVRRLYLVDEMSLKDIIAQMKSYGLLITKAQLEYKLKQWNFRKYIDKATWISIDHQIAKRKRAGKDSQVIHCGKRLKQATIEKETTRHRDMTIFAKLNPPPSPEPTTSTDTSLVVCTPPAFPMEFVWPSTLPWMKFQAEHFQLMLKTQETRVLSAERISSINSGNTSSLLCDIIAPASVFECSNSPYKVTTLADLIGRFMPECYPEEHLHRAYCLLNGSKQDSLLRCFEIVVYRLSNNLSDLFDSKVWKATTAILYEHGIMNLRVNPLVLQSATIQSFMETLFRAAIYWTANVKEEEIDDSQSFAILEWLLSSGQSPNISMIMPTKSNFALTPLQYVVAYGNLCLIHCLLNAGADVNLVHASGRWSKSPLELALECHYNSKTVVAETVRALLQFGASLNLNKALHLAIERRHVDLVVEILQRGADLCSVVEKQDDWFINERDALTVAAATGLSETRFIMNLLATQYSSSSIASLITPNCFLAAALGGNDDTIGYLYKGSGYVLPIFLSFTPLQVAAWAGNMSTCQLLLSLHCPPFSVTVNISPLHLATYSRQEHIVRLLLDRGANVNATATLDESLRNQLRISRSLARRPFTPLELTLLGTEMVGFGIRHLDCAAILIRAGATLLGSEVLLAAKWLHIDLLSAALAAGGDPNSKTSAGLSALQCAMSRNRDVFQREPSDMAGAVAHLLRYGATLRGGEIILAISSGDWDLVNVLLRHGGSLMDIDHRGMTALEAAIMTGSDSILEKLLELCPIIYDAGSLCAAITAGKYSIIDQLLIKRPPHFPPHVLEMTAVGLAAKSEDICLLRKLFSYLPLSERALVPISRYCGYFIDFGSDQYFWHNQDCVTSSPLIFCVMAKNTNACYELLRQGFRPDKVTWALVAQENDLSIAQAFIDNHHQIGDDSVYRSLRIHGLLTAPIKRHTKELILRLLQAGADVNEYSLALKGSRSALQLAVELADCDLIDFLLTAGADINAPPASRAGGTALQLAAAMGHLGIAKSLLELGADINAPPAKKLGRTALEAAAEQGRLDMVRLLLDQGVQTTGTGQRQYIKAVKLAMNEGHHAAARLLREFREWSEEDQTLFEWEQIAAAEAWRWEGDEAGWSWEDWFSCSEDEYESEVSNDEDTD